MAASACIFCKIVAGEIPCHRVAETARALAFMDINPLARGHVLVILKQHAARLHEADVECVADVGRMLATVSRAVAGENGMTEYNILQNNGPMAHQEVPHVHFHIIPKRDKTTGLHMEWNSMATDHAAFAADAEAYRAAIARQAAPSKEH